MITIKLNSTDELPNNFTGIVEYSNGTKEWWIEGKLHRLDGPACEYTDGDKFWWIEGKLHRLDGPACEYTDGTKYWYKEGKRHRLDGPAIEYADGTKECWVDNKFYSHQILRKMFKTAVFLKLKKENMI